MTFSSLIRQKCFHLSAKIQTNCTISCIRIWYSDTHTHGVCLFSCWVYVCLRSCRCVSMCWMSVRIMWLCVCAAVQMIVEMLVLTHVKILACAIMNFPVINTCRWVWCVVCVRMRSVIESEMLTECNVKLVSFTHIYKQQMDDGWNELGTIDASYRMFSLTIQFTARIVC